MTVVDPGWFDQSAHRLRFGWGPNGLRVLAPGASVVVIVDVLSFSTAVDVAVDRGAIVLPYRWHDGSEGDYARANDAIVARRGPPGGGSGPPDPGSGSSAGGHGYSLRPSSLTTIGAGVRLVLPSPNGSALTFGAVEAGRGARGSAGDGGRLVLVGCLRNATAVGLTAAAAASVAGGEGGAGGGNGSVAVIAAGERWRGTTGPLRPAVEDLLGAGAVLDAVAAASEWSAGSGASGPRPSPEALAAIAAFREAADDLPARLRDGGSGRELIARGHPGDVELAAALDVSPAVPTLVGNELVDGSGAGPRPVA
jgi:2-phosphosulfolactate phosphatase